MAKLNPAHLVSLKKSELLSYAEADERYGVDPLFTELVQRYAQARPAHENHIDLRYRPTLIKETSDVRG